MEIALLRKAGAPVNLPSSLLGQSKTKKNDKKIITFQRDVPNDPGKRQFLPDFSYDSVLILHPELSSPDSSFEENMEHLLNKEMQVIHHLNNPINQQKHERNLLKKPDAFQRNGGPNRFTYQDNDPDEHTKAFLEYQKFLRREREKAERIYENGKQENYNGSMDNDSKMQKKQKVIIDLEKFLKDFNLEKMMDNNRDRKENLKLSNNNDNGNFDKANNTNNYQDLVQKYFHPVPPNHPKVHQQKRKKKIHRKEQEEDELDKRNIHPSEQYKNKMKLQTIKTSDKAKTFIDAQFSSRDEVLNQIVEFSKLLPNCLEIMNKLFNDLEIKTQNSKDQKDNSHFISHPLKIPDSFPAVLNEECENEADKQKIRHKTFCTTSSQTDFAELTDINSSVLTSAMFEYVCDVIKAARRLLYSVTIKNCNYLQFGEIIDGLSIPKQNNIGFNDFENILESWKNFMNKPENASFRIDQNYINEALEKKHLDNERHLEEKNKAWQYESNKEPKDCEVRGKSDLNHDLDKDPNHPFEPQRNNQSKNEYACSLFQQEICHQNENYCDDCNSDKKTTRKQEQDSKTSNASRSNKKSSNHSVEQNKKLWDDINGPKERHNNGNISRSQSDSAISLQSNQNAHKKDLARAFLSRLEKICQTDERDDPFFRSSPGIIQISTQEPSTDREKAFKSTGDLPQRPKSRKSRESEESSDRETEHKGKESFSLLDPRRYPIEKKREKLKNLFYKIPDDNKAKDKHGGISFRKEVCKIYWRCS
ncbi:uncharacterized protein MAL13P1.304-like [Argiope bruennichi]|uniref:uncharacterized protein MAL13P1.304-like n=1 Tax=Argiope bruennichi TaxID=94029 RepID=UPI0024956628|nr:uncharacterized protein MAL13P1.304-like [Argiope bruennichi]